MPRPGKGVVSIPSTRHTSLDIERDHEHAQRLNIRLARHRIEQQLGPTSTYSLHNTFLGPGGLQHGSRPGSAVSRTSAISKASGRYVGPENLPRYFPGGSHIPIDDEVSFLEAKPRPLDAENYLDTILIGYSPTTLTLVTVEEDDISSPPRTPTGKPRMTSKFLLGASLEDDEGKMLLPLSKKCLEDLISTLHLPTMPVALAAQGYYARYGTTCLTTFEHGTSPSSKTIGLTFSFRDAFVGGPRAFLTTVFSPSTSTTYTIFFSRTATNFNTITDLHSPSSSSPSASFQIFHPAHASIIFTDSVRAACDSQHEWLAINLVDIEMESGFQSYSYPYTASVDTVEESEKLDFVTSLQKLKRLSDGNAANASRRVNLDRVLEAVESFSQIVEKEASTNFELPVLQEQRASVAILQSWCDGLESRQEFISGRIQWQLSIIPSYLAHRDSKINISIARDSKGIAAASRHDSTAMKTVSFLTAGFLPGTFVAAVFAMPLFNWDAKEYAGVLSERFWVFWAVTLPLTAVIFGGTVVWTWRRRRAVEREGEDAKAEIWSL